MGLLPKILPLSREERQAKIERELLAVEAQIGGELFGPVPKGHFRQFFCLDEHTWVWHEEWIDSGKKHAVTTRYNVRPSGVLKIQDGKPYQQITVDEYRNLLKAAELYEKRVEANYQRLLQAA
jgi:hypothetical protein